MQTYTQQYETLQEQLQSKVKKLLDWKGEDSDHIDYTCLKINRYEYGYDEIALINGRLILLNNNGNQYFWEVMETHQACQLVDQLSIFTPRDNRSYPLRKLRSRTISLEEYPNFSTTGSIEGMKKLYYGQAALLVKNGNYIYNVTRSSEIYFEHST